MNAHVPYKRIGDLLRLERRLTSIDPTESYRLIGVYSFGKGIFHREPTIGADLGAYRFSRIREGDLVLSNIQAWEGAIALAGAQDDGCIGTHRFLTYVPIDNRVDTSYLRYFFLSEKGMELIRMASPGSVVRNRTLGISAFESLKIPLPSLVRQREIATHLGLVRSKTREAEVKHSRVDEQLAAVVTSLVTRGDLSDRQKVQRGWARRPLGEVMRTSTATQIVDPDRSYRIAGVYSFGRGLIDRGFINGGDTRYKSLAPLVKDDIVISRLGGWEGAVAVVGEALAGAFVSPEFPVFRPNPGLLNAAYFRGIAKSPWLWEAIGEATRGSMARRKRIKAEQFLQVEIWLPPIAEQDRIAVPISRALAARRSLERGRELLSALTPSVLNSAFADLG